MILTPKVCFQSVCERSMPDPMESGDKSSPFKAVGLGHMAVRRDLTWVPRHWVYKEEISRKDDQPVADGGAWRSRGNAFQGQPHGGGAHMFLCVGFLLLLFGAFLFVFYFHYYWKKASCRNCFLGFFGGSSKINEAKLPQPRAKNIYAVLVSRPEQIPRPSAWGLCRLKIPILSTGFLKEKLIAANGFPTLSSPHPSSPPVALDFSFTLRCLIWTQQVPTHPPAPSPLLPGFSRFQAMIPSVVRAEGSPQLHPERQGWEGGHCSEEAAMAKMSCCLLYQQLESGPSPWPGTFAGMV